MRAIIVFAITCPATLTHDNSADHITGPVVRDIIVVAGPVRDRSRYKSAVSPVPLERYRPCQALF